MSHTGKVLVVDDKLENIQILYSLLGEEGYEVNVATNGPQALKDVKSDPPDIILLDVNMPKMDGFEVCRLLKKDPETSLIPVIFITGNNNEQNISKGFAVGAVDYVTKPIRTNEMISRINTHLKLQKAVNDAKNANRAKDDFLAMISHEIRTPLNVIMGFTQLLAEKCGGEVLSKVNLINSSGKSLLNLINDVLDISKIEAGQLNVNMESFPIGSLLKEVHKIFTPKVQEKGLNFNLEITDSVPSYIVSDEHRLRQTLFNLLGNALKFTNKGSIEIKASARKTEEGYCDLFIDVIDSGRGIPEEDQKRVFDKYRQVNHQNDSKLGGTGLGLSISSKLIHLLNGELLVESEWGKGSKFSIYLKHLKTPDSAAPEQHKNKQFSFNSEDILIVDDNPANRSLIAQYLTGSGLSFRTAEHGKAALEEINDYKPDLILMDLQMDIMNGIDATKTIRKNDELKDIPVIAVTANQLQTVDDVLFDSYLLKPVERYELLAEIAKYLETSTETTSLVNEEMEVKPISLLLTENHRLAETLKESFKDLQESYTFCDYEELYLQLDTVASHKQDFKEHLYHFKKALNEFDLHKSEIWVNELRKHLV